MEHVTVAELNGYVKALMESDPFLEDVWVVGEISNFKRHSSGHLYLTLKHNGEALDAVCFRSAAQRLTLLPANGLAVVAHGNVSTYGSRIQLYIDMLIPDGVGALQVQFERLHKQLEYEGLFDRKRSLPLFPRRIGLVTSPTSAALQDMLNVLTRRFPLAEVVLSPAVVQGAAGVDSVVQALYALYDQGLDVIILGRGGGSIEDLWCFNEEAVARALFASPIPTVTGVGHETDTTIVDFVADLRAPTPSAAAELVVPHIDALRDEVQLAGDRLATGMYQLLEMQRSVLAARYTRLEHLSPIHMLYAKRDHLTRLHQRAQLAMLQQLKTANLQTKALSRSLAALNPQATLQRGYAVVRDVQGRVVTQASYLAPGDMLTVDVYQRQFKAAVVDSSS